MIEIIAGLTVMAIILICFCSAENKRRESICGKCKWFDDYIGCCTKYGKVTKNNHSCHNFEEKSEKSS